MTTEQRPHPPDPAADELRLSVGDPGELLAAVPHLLGFRPEDSLVLVAVHGSGDGAQRSSTRSGGPHRRLGTVARADLPAPDDVEELVAGCAARMVPGGPSEVIAVVVTDDGPDGGPPRADVADAVSVAFRARGVPPLARLWAPRLETGAPWRCYPPCDCGGRVGRVDDGAVAAASAVSGRVTYGSRNELEATLDPLPTSPRLAGLITAEREAAVLDRELGGPSAARRDLAAVVGARAEVADRRVLGDAELARQAVALGVPAVRDLVMGWAVDPEPADVAAAEQLWTLLARSLPAPSVAEPAVLLACALIAGGGSALVGVALERARRADPGHRLARLVGALVSSGADATALRRLMAESSADAAARLRGRAA
ncbi:DUF4192 domain-containing protein [Actinomycetospora chlora]|uniref:DUF4192 domain-containing protein n=1 Tax=Actinomycetospora chlora TaxID=663608 RepID=A0ABP9BRJ7_9PSEU